MHTKGLARFSKPGCSCMLLMHIQPADKLLTKPREIKKQFGLSTKKLLQMMNLIFSYDSKPTNSYCHGIRSKQYTEHKVI